ncbi:MAG TPA: hypothetical protein VJV78_21525 [Polyangiales bacterium]|nr:hypothetical protein [Polyangiales bacterium]
MRWIAVACAAGLLSCTTLSPQYSQKQARDDGGADGVGTGAAGASAAGDRDGTGGNVDSRGNGAANAAGTAETTGTAGKAGTDGNAPRNGGSGMGEASQPATRCTPPVSGGLCDPSAQCGCPAAENCVFFNAELTCVAKGDVAPYHKCSQHADCQLGYQCVRGACHKSCKNADDDSCEGSNAACIQLDHLDRPISGAYVCTRDCNPADPKREDARFDACGPGLKCEVTNSRTGCTGLGGMVAAGQTCTNTSDCAPGLQCIGTRCQPWCEIGANDCTGGGTCASLASKVTVQSGIEFGYCCSSPSGRGPCDTAPQCGCPADQSCRVIDADGTTACRPIGNAAPYSSCEHGNVCPKGYACVGDLCKLLCDGRNPETCPSGRCGALHWDDDREVPGAFACAVDCNPANPNARGNGYEACGNGATCHYLDDRTDCTAVAPNASSSGGSCADAAGNADDSLCVAGYKCLPTTLTCNRYCELGGVNTCPSGQACTSFTERPRIGSFEIGFCN